MAESSEKNLPVILIIDDEKSFRESLVRFLEDYDYLTLQSENGLKGLELFQSKKPDLVLLNLRLPEMDGLAVLARLKKESPETPVLVLSGADVIEDVVEALRLGAWNYLMKPIPDESFLMHAVETTLERAWLLREKQAYHKSLEKEVNIRTMELEETTNALRRSEQRFKDISYSMADWIWEIDKNAKYILAAGKVKELLGYEPDELLGKTPFDFMPQEEKRRLSPIFEKIAAAKEPIFDLENWNLTKFGEEVCLLTNGVPILGENGELLGYRGVDRDITDRKRAEEEKQRLEKLLQQARKMEAIGTLSGGIAHDFNNLLTVINGHAEIGLIKLEKASQENPLQKKLFKDLNAILQAGKRAESLTRQLLTFSRRQVYAPKVIDINSVIRSLKKVLQTSVGKAFDVKILLSPDVPAIKADPLQIEQILMNLVLNARDAIEIQKEKKNSNYDKKITIETHKVFLDEHHSGGHPEDRRGLQVIFSVSDNGIGMEPELKSKIFEPFFTTKPKGQGTGLGMAAVYGIVKQNKAGIYVYSEPGRGSSIKIYWPSTSEQLISEQAKAPKKKGSLEGSETIFLVEDEPAVRNLARNTLKRFGYKIFEASNGKKALEMLKEKKFHFDLLLTDLIMPEMNGMELAEKIEEMLPDMKILYASGYTDNHIKHTGTLEEGVHFIHKPFSIQELGRKVREILDDW
ncbi:MAG: response regulator [bacterium]|nr:response regulator [bacterium]